MKRILSLILAVVWMAGLVLAVSQPRRLPGRSWWR